MKDGLKVDRVKTINILQANRAKHIDTYKKALASYNDDVELWLRQQLENITQGKPFETSFPDRQPRSYVSDYDRAICLLNALVDDTIELTYTEAVQYINDEWNWRDEFASNSGAYAAKFKG